MRMHSGAVVAALSATLATTGLVAGIPAASAVRSDPPVLHASPAEDHDRFLSRPARGAAAVDRLGENLDEVAAINKVTPGALKELLLEDTSAWVHPSGLIYFVDPAPDRVEVDTAEAAPFPYDQTFELHSKPGSSRTIYLDFNGETVTGTLWNDHEAYLLPGGAHPAFSMDGDRSTFSQTERDVIQSVWQRVSEDFAPFDVDVTTEDPGIEKLRRGNIFDTEYGTRALITPSTAAASGLCGGSCGGVAFMGTFDITAQLLGNAAGSVYAQPAWVFPQNLGPNDAKAIADATSHEVGHNLALDHDGTAEVGYFAGHGAWAPIMGASYDKPIAQWSRGEYAGATLPQNPFQTNPDDLTVMTENGLSYRPDDFGDDPAGAMPLLSAGDEVGGIITTRSDKDYFALPQSCAGNITLTAVPAPTSPNLDIRLRVVEADGTQVASINPTSARSTFDVATGMDAGTTVWATADTPLFAEVDGVGANNPSTNGYSDYASIGQYTLTSTACSGGGTDPAIVSFSKLTQSVGEGAGQAVLTLTRTGNTSVPASVEFERTGGSATPGDDFTVTPGVVSFAAGQAQRTITITIADDGIDEPDETIEVTLTNPDTGTALGGISTSTLTITDDDAVAGVQPDLLISTRKARGYVGDNVYNLNGAQQTKQLSATRGQLRSFFVELTNDGSTKEEFTVSATTAKGAKVTYWVGTDNVTSLVTGAGGGVVTLTSNQYLPLRVDIKPGRRAKVGSVKAAWVTARSTSGLTDVVKATVKVVRR